VASTATIQLPSTNEVHAAHEKLASALSDVDAFRSRVEALSDAAEPRIGQAEIARLLVFATELEDEAEAMKEGAKALRDGTASLYRGTFIDNAA
jgi:hypothetical protein